MLKVNQNLNFYERNTQIQKQEGIKNNPAPGSHRSVNSTSSFRPCKNILDLSNINFNVEKPLSSHRSLIPTQVVNNPLLGSTMQRTFVRKLSDTTQLFTQKRSASETIRPMRYTSRVIRLPLNYTSQANNLGTNRIIESNHIYPSILNNTIANQRSVSVGAYSFANRMIKYANPIETQMPNEINGARRTGNTYPVVRTSNPEWGVTRT